MPSQTPAAREPSGSFIEQRCNTLESCATLSGECVQCSFDYDCHYGQDVPVTCKAFAMVKCSGSRTVSRTMNCRYCYQTPRVEHRCTQFIGCTVVNRERYLANCTVAPHVICLGSRKFSKMLKCDWTSGKSYRTALLLSITLGGFGADRFYLGYWREALGKLFSFGGLGVWTLIDVILIAVGYVTPANGSLYSQPSIFAATAATVHRKAEL